MDRDEWRGYFKDKTGEDYIRERAGDSYPGWILSPLEGADIVGDWKEVKVKKESKKLIAVTHHKYAEKMREFSYEMLGRVKNDVESIKDCELSTLRRNVEFMKGKKYAGYYNAEMNRIIERALLRIARMEESVADIETLFDDVLGGYIHKPEHYTAHRDMFVQEQEMKREAKEKEKEEVVDAMFDSEDEEDEEDEE